MSEPYLNDKLNLETARIAWADLQVYFARGAAVYVAPELDLVAVARLVADDDGREIARLMAEGKFGMVSFGFSPKTIEEMSPDEILIWQQQANRQVKAEYSKM